MLFYFHFCPVCLHTRVRLQGNSRFSHHAPFIHDMFKAQTHKSTQLNSMLRSTALLRARVPPAAATCAGSSRYTSSPPEASVSRRRWRSTDADKSSRNFSGLMPSSDGSWAWQNWGLPQLLVNVPKGEKERETEKCRGASPVTQMPTMNSFLQILNMFGQRWYLLAPPRSVKSDNPHPNIPIVFSPYLTFFCHPSGFENFFPKGQVPPPKKSKNDDEKESDDKSASDDTMTEKTKQQHPDDNGDSVFQKLGKQSRDQQKNNSNKGGGSGGGGSGGGGPNPQEEKQQVGAAIAMLLLLMAARNILDEEGLGNGREVSVYCFVQFWSMQHTMCRVRELHRHFTQIHIPLHSFAQYCR